uniref:AIPP2-like SPOC-like domain-containing protein n=1 Tax=Leersia perrieri TaxID=77586 RepID=A0A0D9XX43_9ORYZ
MTPLGSIVVRCMHCFDSIAFCETYIQRIMMFGPRLHKSTMKTAARPCRRLKYQPKPMMKRILKDFRKTQLAYKQPFVMGNQKNCENSRGTAIRTKADEKMNHIVNDQENRAMMQPPKPHPTKSSVRLPLKVKEQTRTKPMHGCLRSWHNGDTLKQFGVRLKGQSSVAKDNVGEELKEKKIYALTESNILKEKAFLVPNKGHSFQDNKCNDEVLISKSKRIPLHVGLGSTKKNIMMGTEVPNSTRSTNIEPKKHDRDESKDAKNQRPAKKWRQYILDDGDDEYGDQNPIDLEDSTKITVPDAPESVKKLFTQPIDKSIWSGIFKIGGKDYIPFSAHLSTKSCKKVWDLSGSIPSVVDMKKVLRSEVWPKSLEASSPTDDNIGLYFFPLKMRLDKGIDQLVKDIVEKDMALTAIIGEAQMLVFPSTLLPEKYQAFQGKHYLWAAFKRRDTDRQQHGSHQQCKQEQEENTSLNDASKQQHYEAQRNGSNNHQKIPAINKQPSHSVKEPVKKQPSPRRPMMDTSSVLQENSTSAATAAAHTDERCPSEDGSSAVPANNGNGRVIGLVVRQTPGVEELIQQIRRGGALVATMEGELMASSFGATAQHGILKTDNNEYLSLVGHLSTNSCKKVHMLSRSLPLVVNVTKHSRVDENVDQLVGEVKENDLALCAVIGEVEMMIFPSILLPKQYQTFKGKHYMWGMFSHKKDIVGIAVGQESHVMPLENHEGFQDFSEQDKPNVITELEDHEGANTQDIEQNLTATLVRSNTSHVNEHSMDASTIPANHELINSSFGIPAPGMMFAFVARPSPRIELLIKEMENEGALVVPMPGVRFGTCRGQTITSMK